MKTFDILLSFNDGYTQHACVLLASIFQNNKDWRFHIHVLHTGLSEDNINIITEYCDNNNNTVAFYNVDIKGIALPNLGNHYISADTYLRLFLANYLPENINRILYLDVDMIVMGNLSELFEANIDDVVLAAIEDAPRRDRVERLNLDPVWGYFNAGMLLINLHNWRTMDVTGKSIGYIEEHPDRIVQHDQDVLNAVLEGRWRRVDFKWNMLNVYVLPKPLVVSKYAGELIRSKNDVRIVHYTGNIKPWMAWTRNPYNSEYYKYLEYTPWKGYKPSLNSQWKAYKFPRNILTILKADRLLMSIIGRYV